MRILFVVLTMSLTAAVAQTAVPTEFPADAMPAANDTLRERLSGKTFKATMANGAVLRLEYQSGGWF